MVLRDFTRLRELGGFTDIKVEVVKDLAHDGYLSTKVVKQKKKKAETKASRAEEDARANAQDVLFLRQHLLSILRSAAGEGLQ